MCVRHMDSASLRDHSFNVYWAFDQISFSHLFVQHQHHLLGSSYGRYWDQYLTTLLQCLVYAFCKIVIHRGLIRHDIRSIAVSTFSNKGFDPWVNRESSIK